MTPAATSRDITGTTLAVLWIGALILAVFWIVNPFLVPTVWAGMVVVATWPVLLQLEKLLWGRRGLAAVAMTAMLALIFLLPLLAAVSIVVGNLDRIGDWTKSVSTFVIPQPPSRLASLPVVGHRLSEVWREIAAAGTAGLSARVAPHAGKIVTWFFNQAGNLGKMSFEILLTLIISGILYCTGDSAARGVLRFARRLAGPRGEEAAVLAARSVRSVALGVVVTAIVQSTLGGIGLVVSGVPVPVLLTVIMSMLCLAQLGPALVLIPSTIWLFWSDHTAWGIFMCVWTVFVGTIDNFLRPVLIRKGADLPLLLIFAGVLGGIMALGIIGIFIGPVVLAVTYTLLVTWIKEGEGGAT
ncbi:MAG TPA: AI-2E family transporter YdiK [Syntrophorhabdaceae bacterium]|jgi:predicted PurR-regulated permease PerM